jgi:large subunit ribosomal protein L4
MAVSTFTASGAKATTAAKLPKDVFAVEVKNHELLKEAYVAHMANGRENLAKTLLRGDVRGGGRKPWKQKGTGRARVGSTRSPIWRGGGVTFGPSGNENYSKKINAKAKQKALRQALTLASDNKNVVVIEDFAVKDGKTKTASALLAKIGAPSRTIVVIDKRTDAIMRATSNLPEVAIVTARGLNVYEVMNAKNLVFTKAALEVLEARLGGTK